MKSAHQVGFVVFVGALCFVIFQFYLRYDRTKGLTSILSSSGSVSSIGPSKLVSDTLSNISIFEDHTHNEKIDSVKYLNEPLASATTRVLNLDNQVALVGVKPVEAIPSRRTGTQSPLPVLEVAESAVVRRQQTLERTDVGELVPEVVPGTVTSGLPAGLSPALALKMVNYNRKGRGHNGNVVLFTPAECAELISVFHMGSKRAEDNPLGTLPPLHHRLEALCCCVLCSACGVLFQIYVVLSSC
jgi:hypothetical protein